MRVVVVGGGLAGLFTASELVAAGIEDVVVVDAGEEPGGLARTIEWDGFSLEPAAGSLRLPHPQLSAILDRAGTELETASRASVRHVYVSGRLVTLRPSPSALLAPLLPFPAKARALAEPLLGSPGDGSDESLAAFCRRRFGRRAGDLLAWLMAGGVFAGDPEELSARAAFPSLVGLEESGGSVIRGAVQRRRARDHDAPRAAMHLPVGGMSGMARSIAASLGERIRGDWAVESIRTGGAGWVVEGPERLDADHVVLAIRPELAADLLGGQIADRLRRAKHAPVAVVGLGGADPSPFPDGFGVLVGPDEGMSSVGALFESSYAPSRAPHGSWLVKMIVGGARDPGALEQSDRHLADRAIAELGTIVGTAVSPDSIRVVRHRPGIPQYTIGHGSWLEGLDETLSRSPGLHLTGWGYRGVGVGGLAEDAARVRGMVIRQGG